VVGGRHGSTEFVSGIKDYTGSRDRFRKIYYLSLVNNTGWRRPGHVCEEDKNLHSADGSAAI
jgi:hypothetical protein